MWASSPILQPKHYPSPCNSFFFFSVSSSNATGTNSTRSQSTSTTVKCRPAVILPGLGNNSSDYQRLASCLIEEYGVPCVVAKVSRLDWLRNAAGLLDANYWRGTLRPRPVLDWYLERVDHAVSEAKQLAQVTASYNRKTQNKDTEILPLFDFPGTYSISYVLIEGNTNKCNFVLLARVDGLKMPIPRPPPKGSSGVIDQTRGLLDYVEKYCSGAVYAPQLKYVCIAGRYIQGAQFFGNPNITPDSTVPNDNSQNLSQTVVINSKSPAIATTLRARFIGQGYKQVCGQADVWGDGVVPEMSAHLEGALNISLDGVYHSPVGSDDTLRPWYGSPSIVEKWIHHLLS